MTLVRSLTPFPVDYLTIVSLSCDEQYRLIGDKDITCTKGQEFGFNVVPHCELSKSLGAVFPVTMN